MEFCAVAGGRNISREVFKFGRTRGRDFSSKSFLRCGEEGSGEKKSGKQDRILQAEFCFWLSIKQKNSPLLCGGE